MLKKLLRKAAEAFIRKLDEQPMAVWVRFESHGLLVKEMKVGTDEVAVILQASRERPVALVVGCGDRRLEVVTIEPSWWK